MPHLFDPLTLRGLTVRNRAWLSPMCQYQVDARDGVPTDWHLVHLGARAVGGFGLVIAEATAVVPEGRISPQDAGLWNDTQAEAWARIVRFGRGHGAAMGVQLAHAGRKASTERAFPGEPAGVAGPDRGGWPVVGPTGVAFPGLAEPRALTTDEVAAVPGRFAAAAARAERAGFDVVEIHAAHGYLLHQFLSPLTNTRTDAYGGSYENRTRLVKEVVVAVRAAWPERKPLLLRLSATDWCDGGWDLDDSVRLVAEVGPLGVDLADVSTGGLVAAPIPSAAQPGYQVPFAERIRRGSGVPVAAVGRITDPRQADTVIAEGRADAVLIGRAALREPSWPQRAASELGLPGTYPAAYLRGRY